MQPRLQQLNRGWRHWRDKCNVRDDKKAFINGNNGNDAHCRPQTNYKDNDADNNINENYHANYVGKDNENENEDPNDDTAYRNNHYN